MLKLAENWFEQDTAVQPIDTGVFGAEINQRWWITTGPNGGYLAAILLRAMTEAVGDDERAPRSLTIDLTIHFRTSLPIAGGRPGDFALALFNTRMLRDGFLEEDGEIWTPDGLLLAQSRQLAILVQS